MKLTVQFKQFNTHTHTNDQQTVQSIHLQIGRGENLCTSFCWSIYRVQCTLNQCKRAYTIEMITCGACVCVCSCGGKKRQCFTFIPFFSFFILHIVPLELNGFWDRIEGSIFCWTIRMDHSSMLSWKWAMQRHCQHSARCFFLCWANRILGKLNETHWIERLAHEWVGVNVILQTQREEKKKVKKKTNNLCRILNVCILCVCDAQLPYH